MFKRMGELLVECGELTPAQLAGILAEQKSSYRPFGSIASRHFHVPSSAIWAAWAMQYAGFCPRVDLAAEPRDAKALSNLSAANTWILRLLPIRWHVGDLVQGAADAREGHGARGAVGERDAEEQQRRRERPEDEVLHRRLGGHAGIAL